VAVPRSVVPSKKLTVPVGVPLEEDVVVVKVTAVVTIEGLAEDPREVVAAICPTWSVTEMAEEA
jgi:hypothetical protein